MDANFRLKRKKVSTDVNDPSLNDGCAYFVNERAYKTHLAAYDHMPTEKHSQCNNHNAIKLANAKDRGHLAATGVGTVDCARHGMKLPCSVGDLQKGERYVVAPLHRHGVLIAVMRADTSTWTICCCRPLSAPQSPLSWSLTT